MENKIPCIDELEIYFPAAQQDLTAAQNHNTNDNNNNNNEKVLQLAGTLRYPKSAATTMTTTTDNNNRNGNENNENNNNTDKKLFPAAIIIHGSGPIDRNGNTDLGPFLRMNMNTHNQLAKMMVQDCDMVVLCYDKRGIGKSGRMEDYYRAGMMDLVHDAIQAFKYLVEHPLVDSNQIVLVGHSEGAILLPLIAETILAMNKHNFAQQNSESNQQPLPPPKGLIALAGFGETLDGAAKNQRERTLQEVSEAQGLKGWILRKFLTREKMEQQYRDLMEQVKDTSKDYVFMYCGLAKLQTKWYREHLEWDTYKSWTECTFPILAITGGKDVQVRAEYCRPDQAKKLAPNATSLETHVIEHMTHMLRSVEEESPSILNIQKDYSKQGKLPLDPELIQIIGA